MSLIRKQTKFHLIQQFEDHHRVETDDEKQRKKVSEDEKENLRQILWKFCLGMLVYLNLKCWLIPVVVWQQRGLTIQKHAAPSVVARVLE